MKGIGFMVGVILIKDTETGSYRNIRITVCRGSHYTDIDLFGSYATYTLDIVTREILHRHASDDSAPRLTLFELYTIADAAHKYLYDNLRATQLWFKWQDAKPVFKTVSAAEGVYSLPDLHNMYTQSAIYVICKNPGENEGPVFTPLTGSVICSALNFAACKVLSAPVKLYYYSGGAIYADVGVFLKTPFLRYHLKKSMDDWLKCSKLLFELYRESGKAAFSKVPSISFSGLKPLRQKRENDNYDATGALRTAKIQTYGLFNDVLGKSKSMRRVIDAFIRMPYDENFLEIIYEAKESFLQLGERLVEYGYLTEEKYIEFYTEDELVLSARSAALRSRLPDTAASRLKNYRLQSKLPPPHLIDCFGKAIY